MKTKCTSHLGEALTEAALASKPSKSAKGERVSKSKSTSKATQKPTHIKPIPAKGLESDNDDDESDLENELEEENALNELVEQSQDAHGDNDEDAQLLEGFESESDSEPTGPINLPPVPTNREKKLAKKAAAKAAVSTPSKPGTIYLGHIPHGFFEPQMHGYFSQFGTVSRLRLSRNRRTGKSKHYGWVEFTSKDVAEIVAETMDGYLIHPHRLVCKVVEVDEKVWKGANKVFKKIPWQKINREKLEAKRTKEKWEDLVQKDEERSRKRAEKIKELGIDYEFQSPKAKRKADELEEASNKKSKIDSKEDKGKAGISKGKSTKKKTVQN